MYSAFLVLRLFLFKRNIIVIAKQVYYTKKQPYQGYSYRVKKCFALDKLHHPLAVKPNFTRFMGTNTSTSQPLQEQLCQSVITPTLLSHHLQVSLA